MGSAKPSLRLTERDKELLSWIGRFRIASAMQVGLKFGMSRVVTYRRLAGLVAEGYLTHQRKFHGEPGVFMTTRAGLILADLNLPPATLDIRTYRHDMMVTWLAISLEQQGYSVRSEREMRHFEGANPRIRFSVPLGRAENRRHFPDLLASKDGADWGVEVELTPKRTQRLEGILRAYGWARHLKGVMYFTDRPQYAERIRELVRKWRLEQVVQVTLAPMPIMPQIPYACRTWMTGGGEG